MISVVYFGLPILSRFSSSYIGADTLRISMPMVGLPNDPASFMWFLVWWPHAVGTGINPFITTYVWASKGFNLAWSTCILGPALLVAPLTEAFGPVAAYNVLALAAPAISAWAFYVMAWHITRRVWPAVIGGYVYGFSSYELAQLLGHLNLALIFSPPLAVLLFLLRRGSKMKPRNYVVDLALVLVLQFTISTEVFLTMTFFAAIALLVAAALDRKVDRKGDLLVLRDTALGYVLAAIILTPYLYYAWVGYTSGPVWSSFYSFAVDPLNFLIPTPITKLGGSFFGQVTARFPGNYLEEGAYLGLPLLGIVYLFVRTFWRRPSGKLLAITGAIACVAGLGPILYLQGPDYIRVLPGKILGHHVPFPLPWAVMSFIPLLDKALPARFMLYVWFVVALMVALWLAEGKHAVWVKVSLVALAFVFLLPDLGSGYWRTGIDTPKFFLTGTFQHHLSKGENVIIIPYGYEGSSLLWQAQTDMYFRMAGGYAGAPKEFVESPVTQSFYSHNVMLKKPPNYQQQLLAFLMQNDVGAIIVQESLMYRFGPYFEELGVAAMKVDDVWIFQLRGHP